MAEKIVKTPKIVADVQAQTASALDSMREFAFKADVPEAARDIVVKTVQTLKDKSAEAQATLNTANNSFEKIASAFVDTNVSTARNMIAAAFENFGALLNHVEAVAASKSPSDAVQLNVTFAQTFAQKNYDRALASAEAFKTLAADNAKLVQSEVAKLAPALKSVA